MSEDQVKITPESDGGDGSVCCHNGEHYPYGTSINLEKNLIEELGVDALTLGDVVEVRGYAFVDSKSEHTSKEYESKDIRLQLTSLKVRREESDAVKLLYGDKL
jgi:hypothetical protein